MHNLYSKYLTNMACSPLSPHLGLSCCPPGMPFLCFAQDGADPHASRPGSVAPPGAGFARLLLPTGALPPLTPVGSWLSRPRLELSVNFQTKLNCKFLEGMSVLVFSVLCTYSAMCCKALIHSTNEHLSRHGGDVDGCDVSCPQEAHTLVREAEQKRE